MALTPPRGILVANKGVEAARRLFPWPNENPNVPTPKQGWFRRVHESVLWKQLSDAPPGPIVEIGSWLGDSARWFAEQDRDALCIDTWLGSLEHHKSRDYHRVAGHVYESFLTNLWTHRDHVTPVRVDSVTGLRLLRHLGVDPVLVYVDGGHDEHQAEADLKTVKECFPKARLVVDDYDWAGVKKAVDRVLGPGEVKEGVVWAKS